MPSGALRIPQQNCESNVSFIMAISTTANAVSSFAHAVRPCAHDTFLALPPVLLSRMSPALLHMPSWLMRILRLWAVHYPCWLRLERHAQLQRVLEARNYSDFCHVAIITSHFTLPSARLRMPLDNSMGMLALPILVSLGG